MKDLMEGSQTYASVEDLLRYGCNDPEMAGAVAQHGRWRDRVQASPLVKRPPRPPVRRSKVRSGRAKSLLYWHRRGFTDWQWNDRRLL